MCIRDSARIADADLVAAGSRAAPGMLARIGALGLPLGTVFPDTGTTEHPNLTAGGLRRGFYTDTDHRAWVAAGAACQ
eukprot:3441183-Prorocentrum_lima.AAC.1